MISDFPSASIVSAVSLAPQLHRWLAQQPPGHMDFGLHRMHQALPILNHPQSHVPIIHVAGTNGKGSVCHYLDHLLQAAGLTTGRYTSPHLSCLTERFQINGQSAQWANLEETFQYVREQFEANLLALETLEWPHFEKLTVLAFAYFAQQRPDVLLLETGLGGRLDATNACDSPILTIITSIGLDHTQYLGDTLAQIACEKAGIIKPGVPVVLGPNIPPDALSVIVGIANSQNAPVIQTPVHGYTLQSVVLSGNKSSVWNEDATEVLLGQSAQLPILPSYQGDNLATALTAYRALQSRFSLSAPSVHALQHQHPARFEWFGYCGTLLDGSHNADGLAQLEDNLTLYFPDTSIHWVVSLQQSKNMDSLIEVLESSRLNTKTVYWCQGPIDDPMPFYAMPAGKPDHWVACKTPEEAFVMAQEMRKDNDIVVVTGSLHTAGTIRPLLVNGQELVSEQGFGGNGNR